MRLLRACFLAVALVPFSLVARAQTPSPEVIGQGAEVYKARCAMCHDNPQGRIPPRTALTVSRSPEYLLRAMTAGVMREQASGLKADELNAVVAYLIGRLPGATLIDLDANRCREAPKPLTLQGSFWNGWGGRGTTNARYQTDPRLNAADVPKLKVKWVFAYPGGVASQPTIVGGRVFVPSMGGIVYSLDQVSGCTHWATDFGAPLRAPMSVGTLPSGKFAVYFGDWKGDVHALDADTGKALWSVRVDDHLAVRLTGGIASFNGRLYVPVSSFEETAASDPGYVCCTFRGSLVALDASTGRVLWKSHTLDQPPQLLGDGHRMGPAGAAIWSAPTIDRQRGLIYVATGNAYTEPAGAGSNSVIAFDLKTGAKRWESQMVANDVFVAGCGPRARSRVNCPKGNLGPDFDLGASPMLVKTRDGKDWLIASSKSGEVFGLDIEQQGKIVWRNRVGVGGLLGGIEWGGASDSAYVYFAVSDSGPIGTPNASTDGPPPRPGVNALSVATGELIWHTPAPTPVCAWGNPCSGAQPSAPALIPGVLFAGSWDGHVRAYSTSDGSIIWDADAGGRFDAVNGGKAEGGSIEGGQVIAEGMLFVNSGGRFGRPGNRR